MDLFLKILSICSAVGLPSLFTIGCFVVRYVKKHLDIQKQESDALKLGM